MNYTPEWIPFEATHAFSSLSVNYLHQNVDLQPFYEHAPAYEGIQHSIAARSSSKVNRTVLVATLLRQYEKVSTTELVKANIQKLAEENTFTVCTAHQPNIFTGYLYLVYKIVHVIKLAADLQQRYPDKNFVPVFYMGSEDNDLEELNHIYLNGDNLVWQTDQRGAVGRMQTTGVDKLIDQISGQLSVHKFGAELIMLLKDCYRKGNTIQDATLQLTDALFNRYGLVVLIADHPDFKRQMIPVFEDDLFRHTAFSLVKETADVLSQNYHAQVNPREINLFYMSDNLRERIVEEDGIFRVNNTDIRFSPEEMKEELRQHPERFSPNVVLRGLYQETILPNIVFVGGGGEVAYWMELKSVFKHYGVPYPVVLLRNSFLLVNRDAGLLVKKLSLDAEDLFKDVNVLLKRIVQANSKLQLALAEEQQALAELYTHIESVAGAVDITLNKHVKSLHAKAVSGLQVLEKKLMKAEKKKFEAQQHQLQKLKSYLFPAHSLQERKENMLPWYAQYGPSFIDMVYEASPALAKEFGILKLD